MDNFAEQLIKKNLTSGEKSKRIIMLVCGILMTCGLAVTAMLQLGNPLIALIGFVLAAAGGYATYFTFQSTFVEYEYAYTNGELDVDKIIAQKKRQELLSVDVKKFTSFGKYDDEMEETDDMTVVIASDNIASHEYFADFQHDEYGNTRLIFCPDEKMLDMIVKALPSKVKKTL